MYVLGQILIFDAFDPPCGIAYCFSLEIVWLKDHVIYRVQTL